MSLVKRMATAPEKRTNIGRVVNKVDVRDPEIWSPIFWPEGAPTTSGVSITPESSMTLSAVYKAVTILSQAIGSLPLQVFQRIGNGKQIATNHVLYPILHKQPNMLMVPSVFWQLAMVKALLWGNAYATIERDPMQNVTALWPIPSELVKPKLKQRDDLSKGIFYEVRPPEKAPFPVSADDMFHVPGLGFDGVEGKSVISMARESLGLGVAQERYAGGFYGKGAKPSIVLKLSGKFDDLSEKALRNLKSSFKESYTGVDNMAAPVFLEEGMDFQTYSIPPADQQFVEMRTFHVSEVARWFNVPPHKLGELTRATFSNIEAQNIDFVIDSCMPWLVKIEQSITSQLFKEAESDEYFAEFNVDGLLRGDSAARAAYYKDMVYGGMMQPNEARAKENWNPVDGGDSLWMPVNMMQYAGEPSEAAKGEPPPLPGEMAAPAPPEPGQKALRATSNATGPMRMNVRNSYKRVFAEAATRTVRGERRNVMAAVRKMAERPDALKRWLSDYYREGNQDYIVKQMHGPFQSLAEAIQPLAALSVGAEAGITPEIESAVRTHVEKMAYRISVGSLHRLTEIIDNPETARSYRKTTLVQPKPDEEPDLEGAFNDEFDSMEESRPGDVADWETVRVEGMTSSIVWAAGGITTLVWAAGDNCCPICAAMDGKVCGIESNFMDSADSMDVGDSEFSPSWNVKSPPLHRTCVCILEPG